jgi:hypothetical protein
MSQDSPTTLTAADLAALARDLEAPATPARARAAQPISVLYGGAHLFRSDAARRMGDIALAALDAHGEALAASPDVLARVRRKLEREPLCDQRIDFEDGFGVRSPEEEDREATRAAREVAAGMAAGTLAPKVGVRVKALSREAHRRSLATLDRFVTELARAGRGLPAGFCVTLPKVTRAEEPAALARALALLESRLGLAEGAIGMEIMLEAPEILVGEGGTIPLARIARDHAGRLESVHVGSYDLTARLDVLARDQSMSHPACELARTLAKIALAGTGVALSDGATAVLPVAKKGAPPDEVARAVRDGWRLHASDVAESLRRGIHQGWDLHPTQLVSRYATVFTHYREALSATQARLSTFLDAGARASATGALFDDAATAEALLGFFRRGLAAGALDAEDLGPVGLTAPDLALGFAELTAARARA